MMAVINRFKKVICVGIAFSVNIVIAQKAVKPVLKIENLQQVNRTIAVNADAKKGWVVHVNGQPNAGVVWVTDQLFKSGVIEFDVKGKNVMQESFVGIAFHAVNDSTYESVYFRPFNFRATEPIRKKHAVQYIALPKYDWPYLRENFPDKYEATILPDVDPDGWFHVKVLVDADWVKVFVNNSNNPTLTVTSLVANVNGKIGFWTGNGSDGDFANLVVYPQK